MRHWCNGAIFHLQSPGQSVRSPGGASASDSDSVLMLPEAWGRW